MTAVRRMSTLNRSLSILALVLMVLSLWAYRQSIERADRFQRGQPLLSNLNPDEIARIEIRQGERSVTLERQAEQFRVVEEQGYPASNAAVNRLIGDLLEVTLEKEIGTGAQLAEELEIEPAGSSTVEVLLHDGSQKVMVELRLGKSFEEGPGRYARRLDRPEEPIYLTSRGLRVEADSQSFLEKQIVDVAGSEVLRIEGPDFALEREEESDQLSLVGASSSPGKVKTAEVGKLESVLRGLRFEKVFVADDSEVRDLTLQPVLRVDLRDGSGYELAVAERDGRYFLGITGYHSVSQVAISLDEGEEELKEKADLLTRADEIDAFNRFHGSWVYEVSEAKGQGLLVRRAELLDTETT